MSSLPFLKLNLGNALASTALLLSMAACSSGGGGSGISLAANPGAVDQPPSSERSQTDQPGDDRIDDGSGFGDPTIASGGGASGGGGGVSGGGGVTPVQRRVVVSDDGAVTRVVGGVDTLLSVGNADLGGLLDPLLPVTRQVDSVLNPLGQVVVADQALIGSGAVGVQQALAISALSNGQPTGQLAAIGLLNAGQLASLSVGGSSALVIPAATATPGGAPPVDLATLDIGGQTLLGGGASPALVGVGLGSTTPVSGQVASVNLGADANLGVTVGAGAVPSTTSGIVIPIPGVATVGLLNGGSIASVASPLLSGLGR